MEFLFFLLIFLMQSYQNSIAKSWVYFLQAIKHQSIRAMQLLWFSSQILTVSVSEKRTEQVKHRMEHSPWKSDWTSALCCQTEFQSTGLGTEHNRQRNFGCLHRLFYLFSFQPAPPPPTLSLPLSIPLPLPLSPLSLSLSLSLSPSRSPSLSLSISDASMLCCGNTSCIFKKKKKKTKLLCSFNTNAMAATSNDFINACLFELPLTSKVWVTEHRVVRVPKLGRTRNTRSSINRSWTQLTQGRQRFNHSRNAHWTSLNLTGTPKLNDFKRRNKSSLKEREARMVRRTEKLKK